MAFDEDSLREECGVFAIFGHPDAAQVTALGLHALQHRGQEAAGVITFDGQAFAQERRLGLVGEKFTRADLIKRLSGFAAVGHVRYSTSGGTLNRNIQPLFADLKTTGMAVAHNGNLTNAFTLREKLVSDGAIFQSTSDTEVIVHLTARAKGDLTVAERLSEALKQVEGAYSLAVLSNEGMIGIRDPLGVRPLVLGRLALSDAPPAYIVASETCALDIVGAEFVRDVAPGELIIVNESGVTSHFPFLEKGEKKPQSKFCVFEYIYFARPDSVIEDRSVYRVRKNIGAELAKEAHIDADIVSPVPDSGNPAAMGYAEASGIPFETGIIRNHYIGRTFIEPTQHIRDLGVRLKHNANRSVIAGKRVILVDDSVVRGTTSRKIVEMIRSAGAREVHLRIASPPTQFSCFYGVDTPERSQLLAARMTIEEMRAFIGADSLAFISIDGLYRAAGHDRRNPDSPQFCDACFSGDYPIPLTDNALNGGRISNLKPSGATAS